MKIPIIGQTYKDDDIYFDGHSWVDCKFDNCNIIIERGEFDVFNCEFNRCKLTPKGNAIAILKMAKLISP